MKKIVLYALALSVLLFPSCVFFEMSEITEMEVTTPDYSSVEDGTYSGSYDASMVKVSLKVGLADSRIRNIDILSHDCGQGRPAEAITESVIREQSLEVDTVSGATASSKAILMAIRNALLSANTAE
ncbi:MAG: FMN-binding protein [Spirochaetia bacterium]